MRPILLLGAFGASVLVPFAALGPHIGARSDEAEATSAESDIRSGPVAQLMPTIGLLPVDEDAVPSAPHADGAVEKAGPGGSRVVCDGDVCRIVPGGSASAPPKSSSLGTGTGDSRAPRVQPSSDSTTDPAGTGVTPAGSSTLTWRDARQTLTQYGVQQFRLETWGGKFRFSCSVPVGGNRFVTREFEARAASDMEAVAVVLSQLQEWNAQQQISAR